MTSHLTDLSIVVGCLWVRMSLGCLWDRLSLPIQLYTVSCGQNGEVVGMWSFVIQPKMNVFCKGCGQEGFP